MRRTFTVRPNKLSIHASEDTNYVEMAAGLLDEMTGDQIADFADEYNYSQRTYDEFCALLDHTFESGKSGYQIWNDLRNYSNL